MGLGQPHQMVELVARGVDIFDCVLPTRVARHATVYTRHGTLNLRGARSTKWTRCRSIPAAAVMLVKTSPVPIFAIYSKRVKSSRWSWSACITCTSTWS